MAPPGERSPSTETCNTTSVRTRYNDSSCSKLFDQYSLIFFNKIFLSFRSVGHNIKRRTIVQAGKS